MNIVILSCRISGNDGVSLECRHWKEILRRMGHKVTFLAGELDSAGILIPELHFQWPQVMDMHDKVVYGKGNYKEIEDKIFDIAGTIEGKIRKILNSRKVDVLIVANALALPMHFPLAVALKRVIEELDIPTIAKHYDFWWERKRFLKSKLFPFFERWFPPKLPNIKHVVINSEAKRQLKQRFGIESVVSGDTFDYSNTKYQKVDPFAKGFKKDFGINKSDMVFLVPTRIIPRKRIELAIKLVSKMNDNRIVLVVAGTSGDEGKRYEDKLKELVQKENIRCMFVGDRVGSKRKIIVIANGDDPVRSKIYTLWDCYLNADFVLYPTEIEGFGNNFVEAVYFKKPVILTRYPVFVEDIEPLGFEVISFTKQVTRKDVNNVKRLIDDTEKIKHTVDKNFEIGKANFSYEATAIKIQNLLNSLQIDTK